MKPAVIRRRRYSSIRARRSIWLRIHLWLGLGMGIVLVITGITGSVLVFHQEIDEILNPSLMTVQPDARGSIAYRPIDDIVSSAQAAVPRGSKLGSAAYPRNDSAAFNFVARVPVVDQANNSQDWEVHRIFVNPYDAKVIGTRLVRATGWSHFLPRTFMPFMFSLHYNLLLPNIGGTVVGVCAVLLCFSLLTGLILWWPLDRRWHRVLTIKSSSGKVRFNHDLHQATGFYTSLVMFAVLISGIYFVLPNQFMAVLHVFSPEAVRRYEVNSAPLKSDVPIPGPIGLEKAIDVVLSHFPDGHPSWLYLPGKQQTSYMVCQEGISGNSRFVDRRCTVIDQYSGKILHVEAAGVGTAGDTFIAWQWPLHSGQAFGWPGRILVFICGFACPALFITGVIRWQQKRRARRLSKQRRAAQLTSADF